MIDRKKLADNLTECFENARKEYAACEERDRVEQAREGAKSIKKSFVYDDYREQAERVVNDARARALSALDDQMKQAELKLTDAPGQEETNYILSINGRTDYTQQEMEVALSRYKSHAAQKAILNTARASELSLPSSMTSQERDLADLRDLRSEIERTYSPMTFGSMSDGMAAVKKAGYQSFADGNGQDALTAFSYLGAQV